jgi:hypothetical protein
MKPYAIAALCLALIASGWFARSWYEDSISLAVHDVTDSHNVAVAEAIAKMKVENKTIYNKTIERITTDIQYKECKADAEMMLLTNRAIMGE